MLLIGAGGTWTYGGDSGIPRDTIDYPPHTIKLSYEFYYFLRWIIFITSLITIFAYTFTYKRTKVTFVFTLIAMVFNPIFQIYFSRETWVWIDYAVAFTFFSSLLTVNYDTNKSVDDRIYKKPDCGRRIESIDSEEWYVSSEELKQARQFEQFEELDEIDRKVITEKLKH